MAVLHEAPDVTVRRSIARVRAVVQQNVSSHHWNGSDECRCIEPGDYVAADIRRRRRSKQAETASGRSRARQRNDSGKVTWRAGVKKSSPWERRTRSTTLERYWTERSTNKNCNNIIVSQDKLYPVEAVEQRRKKGKRAKVLVKWSGYPASFNTWIDAKAVVAYKG